MAAAVRQASTRLQALLTRGADVLQHQVAPTVRKSYTELMEKNAGARLPVVVEYVVKDPVAAEKLGKQYVFTTLASLPARYAHAQQEAKTLHGVWARRGELSLSEAGWYGVFAAECFAWFCVGEIVARGGLIDYN